MQTWSRSRIKENVLCVLSMIASRGRASVICALSLFCLTCEATASRQKVIIDQDALGPGGSNMGSMLVLIQSPEIEVLGITIESGDGWQRENIAHTLRMLELIGRTDIPVVPGVTLPLVNSEKATAVWEKRYGSLHYKGAWNEDPTRHAADVIPALTEGEPTTKPAAEQASAFIIRMVRANPGQVMIVALGPLTNLGVAAKLDEGFAGLAESLVVMGGSLNPTSSVKDSFDGEFKHTPRLEFNMRWDPEAAKITFHASWKKITLLPVDATTVTRSTPEMMASIKQRDTLAGNYLVRYQGKPMPMWDEITAAICVRPSLIKESETLAIDVDTDSGAGYGNLLSWEAGKGPGLGEPNMTVVRSIDTAAFEKFFIEVIGRGNRN